MVLFIFLDVMDRFAYLTSGSKLEAAVEFPLELDPSQVCGVEACSPSLHLVGCVCHSGSKSLAYTVLT